MTKEGIIQEIKERINGYKKDLAEIEKIRNEYGTLDDDEKRDVIRLRAKIEAFDFLLWDIEE